MNRFFAICCAVLLLAGCAYSSSSVLLALDGPNITIAGRGESPTHTRIWTGTMERGCMAGFGTMILRGPDGLVCEGAIDHPASDKGRLYIELACSTGDTIVLVYRNLGPDQGMGVGRMSPKAPDSPDIPDTPGAPTSPDTRDSEKITIFYHPSASEARRRLDQTMADIAEALERKRKKDEAKTAVSQE